MLLKIERAIKVYIANCWLSFLLCYWESCKSKLATGRKGVSAFCFLLASPSCRREREKKRRRKKKMMAFLQLGNVEGSIPFKSLPNFLLCFKPRNLYCVLYYHFLDNTDLCSRPVSLLANFILILIVFLLLHVTLCSCFPNREPSYISL